MGGSTFFDAFAPPVPGWVYLQTFRATALDRIVDANGKMINDQGNKEVTIRLSDAAMPRKAFSGL